MNDEAPGSVERLRYELTRLQTTPQQAAVFACLLDLPTRDCDASFAELALVNGKLLFARAEGDDRFRHFVGRRDDLVDDLVGFVRHLRCGPAALAYVLDRITRLEAGESPKRCPDAFGPSSLPPT